MEGNKKREVAESAGGGGWCQALLGATWGIFFGGSKPLWTGMHQEGINVITPNVRGLIKVKERRIYGVSFNFYFSEMSHFETVYEIMYTAVSPPPSQS